MIPWKNLKSPGRPRAGSIHFFLGRINRRNSDFSGVVTKARKVSIELQYHWSKSNILPTHTDTTNIYKSSKSTLRISQESHDRSRSVKSPTIRLGQLEYLMHSMSQMPLEVVFSPISGRTFTDLELARVGKQRVLACSRLQKLPTQRLLASICKYEQCLLQRENMTNPQLN